MLYGAAEFVNARPKASWARLAWHWLRRPRLDPLAALQSECTIGKLVLTSGGARP